MTLLEPAPLDVAHATVAQATVAHSPATPRQPHRVGTPRLLLTAGALITLFAGCVAVFTSSAIGSDRSTTRTVGHQAGPAVVTAQNISFALGDMDAQVANYLLVGTATNLGETRSQSLAQFSADRRIVTDQLATAATTGAAPEVQTLLDGLTTYQGEVSALEAAAAPASALALYRQATDEMHQVLLPTATALSRQNERSLDDSYAGTRSRASRDEAYAAGAAVLLVAVLIGTQLLCYRRSRRLLNPWLVASTLLTLGLTVAAVRTLSAEQSDLHGYKSEAFDSVLALTTARSVAYDANADESRYLLDPDRAGQDQQAFLAKSLQVVGLPADTTIATYDARLAAAVQAAQNGRVTFGGFLGAELDNITFPGEREAALAALADYAVYQRDDRVLRSLQTQGRHQQAIAYDTSSAPGQSNFAFYAFDRDLQSVTAINKRYFASYVAAADRDAAGWSAVPPVGLAAVALLAGLGLYVRLREFSA